MTSRKSLPLAAFLSLVSLTTAFAPRAQAGPRAEEDAAIRVESNLRAGVAKIDVTPPPDTKVEGHKRPTHGARDPIRAAILLFDDGRTKAALVTFDFLDAWDDLVKQVRNVVSKATGTPGANILVAVSHNHSGPGWKENPEYRGQVIDKLGAAAGTAVAGMRPVSIGYGEGEIDFSINRRKVINGRAVVRLNPEGLNDRRVKVLRIDDGRGLAPLAVVMHAVCHPCVFTWGDKFSAPHPDGYPKMSADFPGEAQRFVEKVYGEPTQTLFLQGCSGNIRPNLPGFPYRCGDEADIRWIGRDLGCQVVRAADKSAIREEVARRPKVYPIRVASGAIDLPGKNGPVRAEFQALRIGPFLFLTIPGEPFVEYGLQLEKAIADRAISIVVGYANGGSLDYVCTAQAHKEGGYEPNMTPLAPEAEPVILKQLELLADRVLGDVFESFAPSLPTEVKSYTPSIPVESAPKR